MTITGSDGSLPAAAKSVARTSTRRPRALSASRQAIAALLHGQPEPLSINAIARMTKLHENTIREHLDGLILRGIVVRRRSTPVGRGRPAWLYAHVDDDVLTSQFAECAARLQEKLAEYDKADHKSVALEFGRDWGRTLAATRGLGDYEPSLAADQLEQLLHDLNFSPITHDEEPAKTKLRHCPVLEAAVREDGLICQLHAGLIRGLVEGSGHPHLADQVELAPFEEPGACIMKLPPIGYGEAPSIN